MRWGGLGAEGRLCHEHWLIERDRSINGILAMDSFTRDFGSPNEAGKLIIRPSEASNIVAILSAGTAIGALLSAPIGDTIGRRLSLLVSVAVFCAGGILQVCASNIPMLLVGRYGSSCRASRRRGEGRC
jgi:MFS family permease